MLRAAAHRRLRRRCTLAERSLTLTLTLTLSLSLTQTQTLTLSLTLTLTRCALAEREARPEQLPRGHQDPRL